jgi:hypothetical protein
VPSTGHELVLNASANVQLVASAGFPLSQPVVVVRDPLVCTLVVRSARGPLALIRGARFGSTGSWLLEECLVLVISLDGLLLGEYLVLLDSTGGWLLEECLVLLSPADGLSLIPSIGSRARFCIQAVLLWQHLGYLVPFPITECSRRNDPSISCDRC